MQNCTQKHLKKNRLKASSTEPCRGAISILKSFPNLQINTISKLNHFQINTSLIITFFLALNSVGWGQTADQYTLSTTTGQAAYSPAPSSWTTYTASSSDCDDGWISPTNIGFTFNFEGTSYTQFSYNFNGALKFGGTGIGTATSGLTGNGPIIAAGFNDISAGYVTGSIGYIRHGISGSSPNRVLVVDFFIRNNLNCTSARNTQFQMRLYETTNVIDIVFISTSASNPSLCWSSATTTIGLGGSNSTKYLSISSSAHTASNSSITITPAWPGNGRKYTFTPPAACSALTTAQTSTPSNQTICSGGNPSSFDPGAASGGSGGTISYQWQSATTNSDVSFSDIASATAQAYDPSTLTQTTYYRRKAKRCSGSWEVTSTVFTVTVNADPSISSQPAAGTICVGGTFSPSLNATGGVSGLTYQWQYATSSGGTFNNVSNGTPTNSTYTNQTTNSMSVTGNIANGSGHWYRCLVSDAGNGCTQVTSSAVQLTIVADPGSTNPSVVNQCVGGNTQMTVTGSGGTPSLNYQWYSNSSNSNSGGTLISSATSNSYTPPSSSAGTTYYYCSVSASGSGCTNATSNAAAAIISADPTAPSATKSPNTSSVCVGETLTLTSPTYGAQAGQSCGFEYRHSTNNGTDWANWSNTVSSFSAVVGTNLIEIRVKGGCSSGCEASNSTQYSWTVNALPAAPSANNGSRCGTGMVAISATPGTGETIDWYGASSGGSILTTGTPNPAQGTTSFTTPSISTAVTYYAEARNSTTNCVSSTRTAVTASINTAAYRSAATGNWSDATKWEVSCDGTNWSIANVAPGSGDGAISISNGHNITVAASTTIDELTIDAGATITVNASQTLTIANGSGDDLTVNGSLIINGSVSNSGAIKLNSGGLYNHANGTSIPNGITFASGSTLDISGSATCTNIHSYAIRPHHLTWSSSGAMPTGTTSSGDALTLCSGDFTLSNGSFLANNNGSGSNYSTVSIGGNLNLSSSGILRVIHNSNGSNSQGVGQINITGNFNMTGGTFDFSNSSNATTGAKLNISGNFTHTSGSITATTQPSTTQINLTGTSGTQIIESTGQSCSLTINVAGSNAQCVVAASKTFIQSANTTFIVADGTSTPDLLINGTFIRTGTSLTTTGTMSVASGGTYQHNCNGHALPSATWDAASTCNITGTSSITPTNFGQTFGNLTVNCSGTTTTDANSTVAGNLTITGGALSVGNNFTLGITGNSSITGTLTLGGSGVKTFTGNSTINSSGTLNVSGSGAYSIAGNFTNNGTFSPGTAILSLNGGGAQTLDGSSTLSFSNVTINKSAGTLTASKDLSISGTLTLTSGILDMNSKTLTIGTSSANGTISGGSATSYVIAVTDGTNTSKLIHRVNSSSNTQYVFPIGTTTKYTPVQLNLKGGTLSNAHIEVYTKNGMVTGMNSGLSCHLNRSWFVEPTGITSPSYDIQLSFASGDFSGDAGFDLNPIKLSGGVWYKPSGSLLQNGTTQGTTQSTTYSNGSNPSLGSGTVFWNGLSSFSEFGGGGGGQALPVELLSFNANCNNEGFVDLTWQTASEYNSSNFDLERSRNGSEWQVIQTIPAAGNSNELITYQAVDHAHSEIQYYRLNQVDIDGTNKYYDPISLNCDDSDKEVIQTYPNPSHEGFSVLINNTKNTGEGKISIVDATGAIISEKSITIPESWQKLSVILLWLSH